MRLWLNMALCVFLKCEECGIVCLPWCVLCLSSQAVYWMGSCWFCGWTGFVDSLMTSALAVSALCQGRDPWIATVVDGRL